MRRDAGRRRRWRLRVSDPGRPPRRAAVRRRAGCRARSRGALSRGVRDVSSHRGDVPERVSEHRRIAVLGGVYANAEALAAVLADTRRRDAEAVCCLGDLGGFGAHPDRVFPLLREHDVRVVRGNDDEAVAAGAADCNCGYTDPRDNHYARLSYAYTVAHTSAANRAWLATLPGHRRARPGPHRLLMCHGSPRRINEVLWESTTPDGLMRRPLPDHAAHLLRCSPPALKGRRAPDRGAPPPRKAGP